MTRTTRTTDSSDPTAPRPITSSRSVFLRTGLLFAAPLALAACGGRAAASGLLGPLAQAADPPDPPDAQAPAPGQADASAAGQAETTLEQTPARAEATPPQTEGPYFKPNSPERASLVEPGMAGTRLVVMGRVLTTAGQPVARALLDFWQADDGGTYDNRGYTLRGHQFTDEAGQYRLETIVPGLYPGRTRHIHVKAQAPNGPVLTTQLYFPGEARNARDAIFDPRLVLPIQQTSDGELATFDFVLRA